MNLIPKGGVLALNYFLVISTGNSLVIASLRGEARSRS